MGMIAGFQPSTNGLLYPNSWPNEPDEQIKLPEPPGGTISIGNAANGLCGGMAYAVRDLWEAGQQAPPSSQQNPAFQSPAYDYLVKRLVDSFDLPGGIAQLILWMTLPTHDVWVLTHGTSRRTIEESMPAVRSTIDSGHPCPLCLVCVHSVDLLQMGHNHQVLAYGYLDMGSTTTVWVYDPNWPGNDEVTITFDTSNPKNTTHFQYSTGDHSPVGFYPTDYATADPSPLFQDGNSAPT